MATTLALARAPATPLRGAPYPTDDNNYEDAQPERSTIGFTGGHESTAEQGEIYRSVIRAGGNVSASFASDISNTNSIANADKISNTLVAPDLNTPSAQLTDDSESLQSSPGQIPPPSPVRTGTTQPVAAARPSATVRRSFRNRWAITIHCRPASTAILSRPTIRTAHI